MLQQLGKTDIYLLDFNDWGETSFIKRAITKILLFM